MLSLQKKIVFGTLGASVLVAAFTWLVAWLLPMPWLAAVIGLTMAVVIALVLGPLLSRRLEQGVRVLAESASSLSSADPGGTASMGQLLDGLNRLETSMTRVSEVAGRIVEVEQIAALITRVAHQTHLLAINATMEAARAGESGRGFALVAGEFRRLAEETEESAERVTTLARGLLSEVDEVVAALRAATGEVGSGHTEAARSSAELNRLAQELEQAIGRIAREVGQVTQHGGFTLERVEVD